MTSDGRIKLAHKIIEMMQYNKNLETYILRELGTLADSSPLVELEPPPPQEEGGKKKRRTLLITPLSNPDIPN